MFALIASETSGPWRVMRRRCSTGIAAADRDGFLDDPQRLQRAAELHALPGRIETLAIEVLRRRRACWFAPGDVRLRPMATAGVPGSVAPMTSKSPADMCARYQSDGTRAEMRVVGEQRLAAGGERAVDDPVVRAERFEPSATEERVEPRRGRRAPGRTRSTSSRRSGAGVADRGRSSSTSAQPGSGGRCATPGVRMLRPSGGYGGISSAIRSRPTRAADHAQELVRVVGAEIPAPSSSTQTRTSGPVHGARLEAQQRELRRQRRPWWR